MLRKRERAPIKPKNYFSLNDTESFNSISLSLFETDTNSKNSKQDNNNNKNNKQEAPKRKKYTLLEKKKIVEIYNSMKLANPKIGYRKIAKEYNVPYSCLQDWVMKYKNFKDKLDLENKYRLEGAGRSPETVSKEDILIKWVSELRRLQVALSTNEIILKFMELDKKQIDKSFRTLQIWCLQFVKKYAFRIKKSSIVGNKLKDINRDAYNRFFTSFYNLRKNLGECKNYANIFNMDEIPIYFNLESKTEEVKIGDKNVNINKVFSDGFKFSVILCVSAVGEKLPPLVVFRGKNNEYIEKQLNKLTSSKIKKIFATCSDGSWGDRSHYIYWLRNIFFQHKLQDNNYQKILVLDRGITTYEDDLIHWFNKNQSKFVLIPPGLTKIVQPLDVTINEKFSKKMLYWYIDFKLNNQYTRHPFEDDIIDQVMDIWYDDNFITKNEIIKSFQYTGMADEINNIIDKYDDEVSSDILDSEDELLKNGDSIMENNFGDDDNKIYIY